MYSSYTLQTLKRSFHIRRKHWANPVQWDWSALSFCCSTTDVGYKLLKYQSNENSMESTVQKRCVIGIKGQTPDPDYPVDIWFDSLKSLANVLSKENQRLLKVITEQQPQSVTELATLTGRAVSNVSRTLKTLGKYNLVEMQSTKTMLRPTVIHQEFLVVVNNDQ